MNSLNVASLLKCLFFFFFAWQLTTILYRKMIKNGYKRWYFWGKKSFRRRDWLGFCAPLVVNCILNLCSTAGESYGLSRALQLKSGSCFVLFSPLFCLTLLSVHFFPFVCLLPPVEVWFMVCCWMISGFMYHVIRQQLMQRGPSLLFRAPFFFLGVRIAMMASSNTVFRPFCVKAEHST